LIIYLFWNDDVIGLEDAKWKQVVGEAAEKEMSECASREGVAGER